MKFFRFDPGAWKRYALALGAGLAWAAAFPLPNVAGLAWIAPGLMLAAAAGVGPGAAFRLGYAAGLAHYLTALYWILLIPVAELPFAGRMAPKGGLLALSAYLSLHPALWVWACGKIFPVDPVGNGPAQSSFFDRLQRIPWGQRALWVFNCAALWVGWEMIQARLWTGFPWNLLGASQYQILPLIQLSSVAGVYGVSFLVVWSSIALFCATAILIRRPNPRWIWARELIVPGTAVVLLVLWGMGQLAAPRPVKASLSVALIQPSIPQESIWDSEKAGERFRQLLALSRQAVTNHPDLMIWPESALPGLFRFEPEIYEPVLALAQSNQVWIVLGADDLVWRSGPRNDPKSYDSYNCSFLVSPDGQMAEVYRKRQLVIFGEYIPLQGWLPIMKYFTPISGGFKSGERPVPFVLRDLGVKTSVLICFEDVFPHLAREYVRSDIDFLINLSNNGWFGEGAAQWQHAANAVFRAVENRVPLVRCSNNGLTSWIDERGALRDLFDAHSGNVYGAGFEIVRIPLLAGEKRSATFYHDYGDWFGWILLLWGVAALLRQLRRDRITACCARAVH